MQNLFTTCHNLIETNDGKFKSEKQKVFLESQLFESMLVNSGRTYDVVWKEFYNFDSEGIVSYERESNKKGLTTLWKRGEKTKNQLQKEKYARNLAKHEILEAELYERYVKESIETFGYIVDPIGTESICNEIRNMSFVKIMKGMTDLEFKKFADYYVEIQPQFKEMEDYCNKVQQFITDFRVMILSTPKYNTRIQYSFLASY